MSGYPVNTKAQSTVKVHFVEPRISRIFRYVKQILRSREFFHKSNFKFFWLSTTLMCRNHVYLKLLFRHEPFFLSLSRTKQKKFPLHDKEELSRNLSMAGRPRNLAAAAVSIVELSYHIDVAFWHSSASAALSDHSLLLVFSSIVERRTVMQLHICAIRTCYFPLIKLATIHSACGTRRFCLGSLKSDEGGGYANMWWRWRKWKILIKSRQKCDDLTDQRITQAVSLWQFIEMQHAAAALEKGRREDEREGKNLTARRRGTKNIASPLPYFSTHLAQILSSQSLSPFNPWFHRTVAVCR